MLLKPYMPMLVVRTHHANVAVEMNGAAVGEASPGEHLALPLSDSGEYYIGIYPLSDGEFRYYPKVRKLCFAGGVLQPVESGDVEVYAWPGGVYESVLEPGILPELPEPVFPFTIDQLTLSDGCIATLYYENGLRLAVEEGTRIRYGTHLSAAHTGKLSLAQNGMLCAIAGEPELPGGDVPEDYGGALLILDSDYHELLRISGHAVGFHNEAATRFQRLHTQLGHERKQIYRWTGGEFAAEEPQLGFFTHTPMPPAPGREIIRAFCEAVRYELWEEAFSYLSPGLHDGLDIDTVHECMGEFIGCRLPLSRQEHAMGLIYPAKDGIQPVRVFSFAFENGLIDNISED